MCSFQAPRSLAEVLATFLGPGKVSGPCRHVIGQRRLLVTGELALWLKVGVSVWRRLRHLWSAFEAFLATPLVHALINVGGRMYVPYPTRQWSVWRQCPRKIRHY